MLPILISHQTNITSIILILLTKFSLGFIFGLLVDTIYHQKKSTEDLSHLCEEEHCHCEDNNIVKSTLKITFFIFIVNLLLNSIIDKSFITSITLNNKILSPIITSILGLIPNCASSVIITELYLDNVISFGSCISGLLSGSGVGLLVLFKQNHHLKENILILLTLIIFSSISGIIFNLVLS